ncbi:hypothetical protein [Sorangium sp. So ce363]|uniref:hypothetical protein n=1 Tax=Sorangium sp. So ce363 TaxID=3133304 RepID=UPI003F628CB0
MDCNRAVLVVLCAASGGAAACLVSARAHASGATLTASDLTLLTVPDTHDSCFEDNTFGTFFSLIGLSAPPGCEVQAVARRNPRIPQVRRGPPGFTGPGS